MGHMDLIHGVTRSLLKLRIIMVTSLSFCSKTQDRIATEIYIFRQKIMVTTILELLFN